MSTDDAVHDYGSDERYATLRGRLLSKSTELRTTEATAVAWSEIGYSRQAIGNRMDKGKNTIKDYHEKAMALYGLSMLEQHAPDAENKEEYNRLTSKDVMDLSEERREQWLEMFQRHKSGLPQEWVADVDPKASE